MKRPLGSISLFVLCANAGPRWEAMSTPQKRVNLDRISVACHLPRRVFKLRGGDELHFQPSPKAKYQDVDCALTGLKRLHGPMKIGFVGNETYEPDPK